MKGEGKREKDREGGGWRGKVEREDKEKGKEREK